MSSVVFRSLGLNTKFVCMFRSEFCSKIRWATLRAEIPANLQIFDIVHSLVDVHILPASICVALQVSTAKSKNRFRKTLRSKLSLWSLCLDFPKIFPPKNDSMTKTFRLCRHFVAVHVLYFSQLTLFFVDAFHFESWCEALSVWLLGMGIIGFSVQQIFLSMT